VETISLQVLIGLSVDYVLHVALAFNALSDDPTAPAGENRKKRAEMALTELGVSIIGGCLTTSIATAFLFPAALLLLRKFGQIILISVFISLFNTHFLFIPLVAIVGPVNNYGNIYFSMRKFMDNKNNVNPNT
jgi:predicted RND superfamily exporter protein